MSIRYTLHHEKEGLHIFFEGLDTSKIIIENSSVSPRSYYLIEIPTLVLKNCLA